MQKVKPYRTLLKICIAVLLFSFIIYQLDFEELLLTIKDAYIPIFVFMCFLWFFSILVSALRWRVFLLKYDLSSSLSRIYRLYLMGTFFNNFLPTGFGGDGYKFYTLNKEFPGKKKGILSSMILERGFGFLSMFLLVLLSGIFFFEEIISHPTLLLIFFLSLAIIIVFFIGLLYSSFLERLLPKQILSLSFVQKGFQLMDTLRSIHSNKMFFQGIVYSMIFSLMGIISIFLCFQAFQVYVPISVLLFLVPLINLTGLIPISLNSLGVQEGAAIFLYGVFGVSPEVVFPVYLVNRVLLILLSLTGGILYVFDKKVESLD